MTEPAGASGATRSAGAAGTADAIAAHFRGVIAAGILADGERLPTVRQTAGDAGVALGTAARAYRILESEGLIETRIGSGTRVARGVSALPRPVAQRLRALVAEAQDHGLSVAEVQDALAAIWGQGLDPGDPGPGHETREPDPTAPPR
ncbi:GntR family transcriptional regulator [Leucobacter iarius]|uniref:HTH gntR-type domain-containing protein n=1 Tax=Leucobacter iarius TaxID=333963 RepID=A0ABN2LNX3_9MICO